MANITALASLSYIMFLCLFAFSAATAVAGA